VSTNSRATFQTMRGLAMGRARPASHVISCLEMSRSLKKTD
jgi:hypothetical protein